MAAIQNTQVQIAFGTYRLPAASTQRRVQTILELGVRRIDAAQLYRNEHQVFDAVRRFETRGQRVHVTSKIYRSLLYEQVIESVTESASRLGRRIDTMLLHRCLPFHVWRALDECVTRGLVGEIGVSNHRQAQLFALLRRSELTGVRRPALNQVELHPFVGAVHPLLRFCAAEGVRVEGHTLLGRGEFMDFAPLVRLAAKYSVSPAVVLLRWAHQLGAGLIFSSRRDERVREVLTNVSRFVIDDDDIAAISGFNARRTQRFYPQHVYRQYPSPRRDSERALHDTVPDDTAAYVDLIVDSLREDIRAKNVGRPVSPTALELPTQTTRQILTDPVAQKIAARLFPPRPGKPPHSSFDRYRALIRVLRRLAHSTHEAEREAEHRKWYGPRHVNQQPVADVVANPAAMAVSVAPRKELLPFFRFLGNQTDAQAKAKASRTFVRGTYFADGRVDLCKQVVGPDHIGELCSSVARNRHVRHFLLGNNIACAGPSSTGAESLANLMANPDLAIETWYLAGNDIGPQDLKLIANSLADNSYARSLWLKRNPIGKDGAVHLGWLLAANARIELLDLHNTALFDEGIEALAGAMNGAPLRLRHLYLSANALSARSVRSLRGILREGSPLESLYLSMNRLGHEGLDEVVSLLRTGDLRNLRRLDLGSIGLERPALTPLVDALICDCPELGFLDLGTYKSTRTMGEKANVLGDVSALRRLLVEHPSLKVLDVSLCGLPKSSIDALVRERRPHQSLEGIGNDALGHSHNERRRIKQPASVVHIDSIYRGRA